MPDSEPADRPQLAYHLSEGEGPTIVFLPGYASDMSGTKAIAIERWARTGRRKQAFLRFDYAGCGASAGEFEDQTLETWRDDVLLLIDHLIEGPVVLVGSSMGGWVMLLVQRARLDRVVGMVGIAAAPDFTDWGFTTEQKMTLLQEGRIAEPSTYSDEPTVTTRGFYMSVEANRMLVAPIAFDGPVRLIHGQKDGDVPWEYSPMLASKLRSSEVQTWLVKDGDHRLSRDKDVALIIRAIEDVLTCLLPQP
jgi:pimeloyl-ACP methyl ester carboxylesterase